MLLTNETAPGDRTHRRSTRRCAGMLAAASVALVLAAASPARAADPLPPVTVTAQAIADAQARVQAMGAEVARVANDLSAGTERWQAGTVALEQAQSEAALAQAGADLAAAVARDRRRTLAAFVSANYRSPASAPFLLRAAVGPAGLTQALRADADLTKVRGNQQAALEAADAAGRDAAAADRRAAVLRDESAEKARALAAELAGLKGLAERTGAQLGQATDALDGLEALQAAELARRETARLAAERLAQQAAQDAQATARRRSAAALPPAMAAAPVAAATGGSCAGRAVSSYGNGAIPASALCPLAYAPGEMLRADAAAAFNRLTEASKASRGVPLCVTDSYRSYADQVRVYAERPGFAAVPGTSNHGWGVAVDLCGGVESFGSAAHAWLLANGSRYGWIHPAWAEPGGSMPEPWHWEYQG